MVKIAAQPGNETADVTPELAAALNTAMGGEPSIQGFASGPLARNSNTKTQPEAERASPMPAASPIPPPSALPAASPIPPAMSVPQAPRRSGTPR
jgi:hypothetical protein